MKKLSIIFAFIICLAISSFAQIKAEKKEKPQCKYGEKDYVGESIDLSLTNADIRDVLAFITQQYGCVFVLDKSVKEILVTIDIKDVPWNVILDSILKTSELDKMNKISRDTITQIEKPYIYIATKEKIKSEIKWWRNCFPEANELNKQPLYTEFIQLKYIDKKKPEYLEKLNYYVKRRLSKRGSLEFESNSKIFVITDVKENIEAIKQLINFLDDEENMEYLLQENIVLK